MNTKITAAILLAVSIWGRPAWAVPEERLQLVNFKQQIGKVAEKIQEVVQGEGKSSIAIGQISPPTNFNTNSGPGMVELLTLALESRQQGLVQKKAELSLRGTYDFIEDDGRVLVKLELNIKDKQAKPVKDITVELLDNSDIGSIMQLTGDLPTQNADGDPATKQQRNEKLKEFIEKPRAFRDGPRVKPSADSPFAIEVRARPADSSAPAQPRVPTDQEGEAFVKLDRGEEYEIVIHNGSDREVGANLTVDGLSVFAFSEVRDPATKQPKYTHYIVAPHTQQVIEGWHFRDNPPENYAAFLVTELGKGASARAAKPVQGKIGVISAAFAFVAQPGTRNAVETGFGRPKDIRTEPVKRDLERPRAFVSVRYTR